MGSGTIGAEVPVGGTPYRADRAAFALAEAPVTDGSNSSAGPGSYVMAVGGLNNLGAETAAVNSLSLSSLSWSPVPPYTTPPPALQGCVLC